MKNRYDRYRRPMKNRPMKNRPVYKKKTIAARAAELERATQDEKFVSACTLAGIPPSARQHRKFLRGAGLAFSVS